MRTGKIVYDYGIYQVKELLDEPGMYALWRICGGFCAKGTLDECRTAAYYWGTAALR